MHNLAILDLTEQVEIHEKIVNLADELRSPKLIVYKPHINRKCNSLNISKIIQDNNSQNFAFSSETHICLNEDLNQTESIEKTNFSLIQTTHDNLFIDSPIKNDCGQSIGFFSPLGFEALGVFIEQTRRLHLNNYCESDCPHQTFNSSSESVQMLCPACSKCLSYENVTEIIEGCTKNEICAGGGCFGNQLEVNQTIRQKLNKLTYARIKSSFITTYYFSLFFGLAAMISLIINSLLRVGTDIVLVWLLFLLATFDLILNWDVTNYILLPHSCLIVCPLKIVLRFMMYFIMSLSLWTKLLPKTTLKIITYLGVSDLAVGILVIVYNHVELENSCNNLMRYFASTKQCGLLSGIEQYYSICIIIVFSIYTASYMEEARKNPEKILIASPFFGLIWCWYKNVPDYSVILAYIMIIGKMVQFCFTKK